MTQENLIQNNENTNDNQGFIAAEDGVTVENTEAPADLTKCSVNDLSFEAGDVADIALENDVLIISLKDGSEVKIENFTTIMAATGMTELTLADGTTIDLKSYNLKTAETEEGDAGDEAVQVEAEPEEQIEAVNAPAEETLETVIAEGVQDEQTIAEEVIENLENIEPAAGDVDEVVLAETNKATGDVEIIKIETDAGEQQNLADLAKQLAEVEPAAGEAGGAATRSGGYGFNSSSDMVTSTPLNAIGPIGPTQLAYGITNQNDQTFFLDPLGTPTLSVNNGVNDAIVKEDGSIFVPITAALQGGNLSQQVLTVTISGVDAATALTGGFLPTSTPGVYTITLPAGTNYDGGVTFTPSAQSDLDFGQFSVIATASNPSTGEVESVSDDASVITDAVADKPDVDGDDASTFINKVLDVDVTGSLGVDTDGSETITGYTITSATDLSGFTFSAGTYDAVSNTLTLSPADLVGLQVTPPTDFVGSVDLDVTIYNEETNLSGVEVDLGDNTNSASDSFTLSWVKGPVITYNFSNEVDGDTGLVKEDSSVTLNLQVDTVSDVGPVDGDEVLTVTISDLDPSWAINLPGQSGAVWTATGTPNEYSITLPAGESYNGAITFTPPADSDVDHPTFNITATVTDPVLGVDASDSASGDIVTDAVADKPDVDGDDASTFVNKVLDVDVTGSLGVDTDGSETITGYTITSATDLSGFTFSAGTYDAVSNTLTLSPADLVGLQVTPPTDFVGSVDLDVTIYNEETNLSGVEVDLGDNTNSASDSFTLSWVKGPVITYNFSNEVDGDTGLVKEDSSVTLNLQVDTVSDVGPVDGDEVLTVTISDLDPSWAINLPGQSGAVWTATGTPNEYSITLPAGESYNGAITFTPPADSDVDHPTFNITATVTDPVLGVDASDSASGDIVTDAVIDTPTLTVVNASGEEGTSIALDVSAAIGETSSYVSESITQITLSGLPAGATLNNGAYDIGTDTWTLSLADLAGLEVNVPNGVSGDFNLTISVTSAEDVEGDDAGNQEVDFTDNVAVVSKVLKLSVKEDHAPTADPKGVSVDEHNLPGTLTKTGDLNVDFGDDEAGSSITVKEGVVPTGLTSSGQVVTVVGVGNVFTATNEEADTVFTLTLNADGTYKYEQFLPLDHAEGTSTDDALPIEFCATITDGDNDSIDVEFVVTVIDDAPIANDDLNRFDSNVGTTSGNVILGDNGELDLTDADIDDLSNDVSNVVTNVSFDGVDYPVSNVGNTIVNGEFGVLEIAADGSYTYTLYEGVEAGDGEDICVNLNPTAADVSGSQTSIELNGITISIGTPRPGSSINDGGDLKWVDTTDGTGSGIGIGSNGSGNGKVYPQGEVINVDPSKDASKIAISVADIGTNNAGSPLFVTVHYANGSSEEIQYNAPIPAPAGGIWKFTVDGGDKLIDSVAVYSEPGEKGMSFLLNDVKAFYPTLGKLVDEFEYTLTDFDGDSDQATLKICAEDLVNDQPALTINNVGVDETNLDGGDLSQTGTITVDFGADNPGSLKTNGAGPSGLKSGGDDVIVTNTDSGYEGKVNGETVFTLVLNGDGTYTYTQVLPLDHPNTDNPDDAIDLTFGVVATDEDGDETAGEIIVTVKDDGPYAVDVASTIYEKDLRDGGVISYTRHVPDLNYGEDGAGSVTPSRFAAKFETYGPDVTISSNGVDIDVKIVGNDFIGKAGEVLVFKLEIDPITSKQVYTQYAPIDHPNATDPADVMWLKFFLNVTDDDGDTIEVMSVFDLVDDAPIANDDLNRFDSDNRSTVGNVILGDNGELDLTDADIDEQSSDVANVVTSVSFDGVDYPVSEIGNTIVNGEFGVLEIAADGSYTYTLHEGIEASDGKDICVNLNPCAADVSGKQTSIELNGITISIGKARPGSNIKDGGDLKWVNTPDGLGSGIGIGENGSNNAKVWPQGEVIEVDPSKDASKIALTIADIGKNNAGSPLFVTVQYANGSSEEIEYNAPNPAPSNGLWKFTVDGGDHLIASLEVYSEPGEKGTSFLLNNVKAYYPTLGKLVDEFEYTLTDADGDSDNAVLKICAEDLEDGSKIKADGSVDKLYGSSGEDHFLFDIDSGKVKIFDFDKDQDILDFSEMVEGYDSDSHAIADFVKMTESGSNTVVSVDTNGPVGGADFTNVVVLRDVTGLNVEELETNGVLVA